MYSILKGRILYSPTLITYHNAVLRVWGSYFEELLTMGWCINLALPSARTMKNGSVDASHGWKSWMSWTHTSKKKQEWRLLSSAGLVAPRSVMYVIVDVQVASSQWCDVNHAYFFRNATCGSSYINDTFDVRSRVKVSFSQLAVYSTLRSVSTFPLATPIAQWQSNRR